MGDADRLPMANVSRIVQNALPKDSAIAKEARVALSACATVFVHYVTELAVQQCDKRKKLTLTPDDILEALREAEFDGAASVCLPAVPLRARAPPAAAREGARPRRVRRQLPRRERVLRLGRLYGRDRARPARL